MEAQKRNVYIGGDEYAASENTLSVLGSDYSYSSLVTSTLHGACMGLGPLSFLPVLIPGDRLPGIAVQYKDIVIVYRRALDEANGWNVYATYPAAQFAESYQIGPRVCVPHWYLVGLPHA